jgi:GrpB-like predicted nucleotidyltransferase (UPF0157 family)
MVETSNTTDSLAKSDMPVYLVEYDDTWPSQFSRERGRISQILSDYSVEFEHIGSTAIPGIAAKPIIDIMVLIQDIGESGEYIQRLKELEYHYYPYGEDVFPERRWFCKPNAAERTHHLHLVERDTRFHRDHLLFRNYLRSNAGAAASYEMLKRQLSKQYTNDRDGYTDGKSDFVAAILEQVQLEETKHRGLPSI